VTRGAFLVTLATFSLGGPAMAAPDVVGEDAAALPLWEAGLGLGGLAAPAYPGSATTRTYLAPWPYLVYRGERLKANREGLGFGLFASRHAKLDLSFSGTLPVRSQGTAREGMPDLSLAVEAGVVLKLAMLDDGASHLSARLAVRHASGVKRGGLQNVGWIADPTLRWTQPMQLWGQPVDWGLDLTAKFQDRRYNNFYYQVTAEQVTPTRSAYSSGGGYAGSTLNTGWLVRRGPLGVGAFVGLSNVSGARFAASPLVEKELNLYGGLTLFWVLGQSSDRVPRPVSPL
jgi:outer membrane scaffolding protein for murein synthesis (MipA/OmpV family)